ncbi:MAG: hypothetical protein K6F56_09485 [Oscillospiraceae bacterium]|nr:hypothetical protein [Oscillospiraceae bacterium]
MYALNLSEENRILSATFEQYAAPGQPLVEQLPEGDIANYLYRDGAYVYDPLPAPPEPGPSDFDRLEAQAVYTAMMTDTLLEE